MPVCPSLPDNFVSCRRCDQDLCVALHVQSPLQAESKAWTSGRISRGKGQAGPILFPPHPHPMKCEFLGFKLSSIRLAATTPLPSPHLVQIRIHSMAVINNKKSSSRTRKLLGLEQRAISKQNWKIRSSLYPALVGFLLEENFLVSTNWNAAVCNPLKLRKGFLGDSNQWRESNLGAQLQLGLAGVTWLLLGFHFWGLQHTQFLG